MNLAVRIIEALFTITTIGKVAARMIVGLALLALAAGCAILSYPSAGTSAGEADGANWLLVVLALWLGFLGLKRVLGGLMVLIMAFGSREESE